MYFNVDEETFILLSKKGELTMKVNVQQVVFNVLNALKYPKEEFVNCSLISSWEKMWFTRV